MDSAIWGLIGTLVGALVAGGVSVWNENRKRRADTEAGVLTAAFQFAALEWRGHIKVALRDGGAVLPPTIYLAQAIAIAQLATAGKTIDAAELKRIHDTTKRLASEFCEDDVK